jgi:acyl carrier protein
VRGLFISEVLMLRSTIKEKLVQFVNDYFIKESGKVIDDDTLFLENEIIDSTGVLELVAFIEETFEIRVEDEEIISENFNSINRLVNYLQSKVEKTSN